jgi:hypothetical protein
MNKLNETDRTLHSLSQLLARTGMQWLPAQPDDSQTNLNWNSDRQQLEGRSFVHNDRNVRAVLGMQPLTVLFIDDEEHVFASFSPENRTPDHALTWWTNQMQAWGITDLADLNYHLPDEHVARQTPYSQLPAIALWAQWRTLADTGLYALNDWSGRQSEVRIWPHHFDTGVYYPINGADGQEVAAIWAGYAIADSVCDEPYFYLSGYQKGQSIPFAEAPLLSAGEWRHTADWQGALLPIGEAGDEERINRFFRESYAWLDGIVSP